MAGSTDRVVTVNALAYDQEGHTVTGLNRGDFSLRANGEQREIFTFTELRPSEKLLQKRTPGGYWISNRPGVEDGRGRPATVILLDTRNTEPRYQPWSVSQLVRAASLLGPEEQIAVYQLRREGLFLLHEFTGNHEHLLAAIAPEAMAHETNADKWRLDGKRIRVLPTSPPADGATFQALERLACQMSRYSGRKNLFWISAYFPRLFPYGKSVDVTAEPPAAIAAARALEASGVAVFPVDVRSPVPPIPFQTAPPAIGPGAYASAANNRKFIRSMDAIAEATGGKTIVNRPELAEAIVDTMRATQRSYELSFKVPANQLNGKYHKLLVELRHHGLTSVFKHGYFAQTSDPCPAGKLFDNADIGLSVGVFPKRDDAKLILRIRLLGSESDSNIASTSQEQWQVRVTDTISDAVVANAIGQGLQIDLPVRIAWSSRELLVSIHQESSGRTGTITIPVDLITRAQIEPTNEGSH